MIDPPITKRELRLFITGLADSVTQRRVVADLQSADSTARDVLRGAEIAARHALAIDWRRLLAGTHSFEVAAREESVTEPAQALESAIRTMMNDANDFSKRGEFDSALALRQKGCRLATELWGRENREKATCLNGLAKLFHLMKDNEQSTHVYEEALSIRIRVMGATHSDTGITLSGLGRVFESQGDFRSAERCHRDALTISLLRLGRGPDTGICLTDLGCTLLAMNDNAAALGHLQDALAITQDIDGVESRNTAADLGNLATAQQALGQLNEAEASWDRALNILERLGDASDADLAWTWNNLGSLRLAQDRAEVARDCFARARELTADKLDSPTLAAPASRNNFAVANRGADPTQLRAELTTALELSTKSFGPLHPGTLIVTANLEIAAIPDGVSATVPSEAMARLRLIYAAEFAKPRTQSFLLLNVPHEGQSSTMLLTAA